MRANLKVGLWAVFLSLSITTLGLNEINAQTGSPKIRFARGSNSSTVSGSVNRNKADSYEFKGKAAQNITVRLVTQKKKITLSVTNQCSDRPLLLGEEIKNWSGVLPNNCYYSISITDVSGKVGNANYALTVTLGVTPAQQILTTNQLDLANSKWTVKYFLDNEWIEHSDIVFLKAGKVQGGGTWKLIGKKLTIGKIKSKAINGIEVTINGRTASGIGWLGMNDREYRIQLIRR